MLIELYGKNFGCFRDEFSLSLLATEIDPNSDRGIVEVHVEGDDTPLRLLRAAALFGPNASGKSTVIRAAYALGYLLSSSARFSSDQILRPYEPFALGPSTKKPASLGIKAVIEGLIFNYYVEFDLTAVVIERLSMLDGRQWSPPLFERTDQHVVGEWTNNPQFQLLMKGFRRNALLLSLADSLAPELDRGIATGLIRLLRVFGLGNSDRLFSAMERVAKRTREDDAFNAWLLARLRSADIGVVALQADEHKRQYYSTRGSADIADEETEGDAEVRDKIQTFYRLSLVHEGVGGSVPLQYSRESLGTKRIIEMAPLLYDLSHSEMPRAAFVDELDASMHPLLIQDMIRYFNCDIPMAKARGQLIFATHETTLLDDEAKDSVLRRDQVYLTEKDATGASRLFSIAEFKERNNLNIRRRYLQGRYGALPSLGTVSE